MEKEINSGGIMKKLVLLNVVCNGSTGKIMCDLAKSASNNGYDVTCIYGRGNPKEDVNCLKFNSKLGIYFHVILARLGFNGHGSYFATKKLVKYLKKTNPDIIHMHNIHGYWINLKVLFKYLKNEYKGKIMWTLHDCWSFTGHCSYFTMINCNKWQKECKKCPMIEGYPKEYIDTTRREYRLKKKLFSNLNNLHIITPSNWLKRIVEKSFLGKYPIKAIHNGINLDIFKPVNDKIIKEKYNIPDNKIILLGVANIWEERKGLNVFIELSKMIDGDEVIVLVGVNDKQIKELPSNIIGIKRTENQKELANLYSMANVFINPSVEETFSLVTAEALACGTPTIVCGMSAPKELLTKEVGIVVNDINPENYYKAYKKILKGNYDRKKTHDYAKKFDNENMLKENIKTYKE